MKKIIKFGGGKRVYYISHTSEDESETLDYTYCNLNNLFYEIINVYRL